MAAATIPRSKEMVIKGAPPPVTTSSSGPLRACVTVRRAVDVFKDCRAPDDDRVVTFQTATEIGGQRFDNVQKPIGKIAPWGKTDTLRGNVRPRRPWTPWRRITGCKPRPRFTRPTEPRDGDEGEGPPRDRYRRDRRYRPYPAGKNSFLGRSGPEERLPRIPGETVRSTEIDYRPFVDLPVKTEKRLIPTEWLSDTGSQISIINNYNGVGEGKNVTIEIRGINASTVGPVREICLRVYDKEYKVEVAAFNAPCDVLGVKEIKEIFPLYLNYKKLKTLECKMIAVNVEPVKLPSTPPLYMRRYPIKGGMDEITETLRNL